MDPKEVYGEAVGEACIEVHHKEVHLADMAEGHETQLDDLACLCANCHRVIHRELKSAMR
jgi:5-methylcytosine-specific restriction protein A